MNLVRIDALPAEAKTLSLVQSDDPISEGFEDSNGTRYVRTTCCHGNQMIFRIDQTGDYTADDLQRFIRNATIACDRCP